MDISGTREEFSLDAQYDTLSFFDVDIRCTTGYTFGEEIFDEHIWMGLYRYDCSIFLIPLQKIEMYNCEKSSI
jgi:hypothetical protein